MCEKPMTAIAVALALAATPLAAQEASGEAGAGAEAGAEAGAAGEAGATGGAGADAGAGETADTGAGAGATADADADADADAGATADAGADADADGEATAGADADAGATAGTDAAAETGADFGTEAAQETEATAGAGVTVTEPAVGTEAADSEISPRTGVANDDAARIELGTLTCELEAVTNVLIYAQESFGCTFVGDDGRTIAYDANIEKVGANLQLKTDQTLQWVVLSSVSMDRAEDLSGSYFGASAQASLGVGAGANVLIGGSGDNFTLQPISVTGQEGLGASLTIDSLTLSRPAS